MTKSTSNNVNSFGLNRYIPTNVAREVRKRSGFGCLFCRDAIIQYDHFDPEFKDAESHDPNGIVALCGTHHDKRGSGEISVDMVRQKLADIAQQTVSKTAFELDTLPEIQIGKATIIGVRKVIEIDGEQILSFSPQDISRTVPLLNAKFYDKKGNLGAEIVENEWRGYKRAWDIEKTGNKYIVRSNKGEIALSLRVTAGKIQIDRLNLSYSNASIKVNSKGVITIITHGEDGAKLIIPNIQTRTTDWFHWIKIDGCRITWCSENIHTLLNRLPESLEPLPIVNKLNFGKHKLVGSIPIAVSSENKEIESNSDWEPKENPHGDFEKLTLQKIGMCPHSRSENSTMYQIETKSIGQEGCYSSPIVANLEWAQLAREAEALSELRPVQTELILQKLNKAIESFMIESGKVHSYAILIARKIECLTAMGKPDEALLTWETLKKNVPHYNNTIHISPTSDQKYFKVTFAKP